MNAASRRAFAARAQAVAESLRPGTIEIDGGESVPCALTIGNVEVELEMGRKVLKSASASISKARLPVEPRPDQRAILNHEPETVWTIYSVAGQTEDSWLVRLALFPETR